MIIQITGDSLIAKMAGIPEPLIDHALSMIDPALVIRNTGVRGDNTETFLKRIEQEILCFDDVDKIFILIGTNDSAMNKQISIDDYARNINLIIDKLNVSFSSSQIYFISPPAIDEIRQKFRNNLLLSFYCKELQKIVCDRECHYIDLFNTMKNTKCFPMITKGILNDGVHFGPYGYQILAKLIQKDLNGAV